MDESILHEPRLRFDDPQGRVECIVCAKLRQRPRGEMPDGRWTSNPDRMCVMKEGLWPEMYFCAHCGTGLTGEQIHVVYLATVRRVFSRGDKPLSFH